MKIFEIEIDNKILVACALVLLYLWYTGSVENLSFRPIKELFVTEKPSAYNELYMPRNHTELPVGGQSAKLGSTTTWFARGGQVGGMDVLKSASGQGFSRPDYFQLYKPGSHVVGSNVPAPGNGLLPDGAALLDVVPSVGPSNPELSSMNDRSRDLSGRNDIVIPRVNDGSNNQSSTPAPANA
jgi:hypothetical protein